MDHNNWESRNYHSTTSAETKSKMSETCLIAELIKDKKNQKGLIDEIVKNSENNNKIETIVSRRPDTFNNALAEFEMENYMSNNNNNNNNIMQFYKPVHENENAGLPQIKTNGTKAKIAPPPLPTQSVTSSIQSKSTAIPATVSNQQDSAKKSSRKSLLSLPMPPTSVSTVSALNSKEKLNSIKMGVSYLNNNDKPFSTINTASSPSSSDSVENAKKVLLSRLEESRTKNTEKVLKHPTILHKSPPNPSAWNDRCVESFSILNRIGEGTYGMFSHFSVIFCLLNHFFYRNCFQSYG